MHNMFLLQIECAAMCKTFPEHVSLRLGMPNSVQDFFSEFRINRGEEMERGREKE